MNPDAQSAKLQFQRSFLLGGGELGERIRAFDWSNTELGALEDWPQSLRSITSMLLLSPVPMVLLWGERGIMIYNDAYSEFAGARHPQLLGSEVRLGWPEVADFNDHVMKVCLGGGTLAYKDQELTLYRNGQPERVWMNLDYSPVPDESGQPAGVIAIVVETTERVIAEQQLRLEQTQLARLFAQAPGLMAMLNGPEHVFELANPAFMQLVGDRSLIGRPVLEALPEVTRQGFVELLDRVYSAGKAFVGNAIKVRLQRSLGDAEEERILDFVCQPVTDSEGAVSGIFIEGYDVTERAEAEDRVRSSEERFRALVNAATDVVYSMDPDWTLMRHLDGEGFISDTQIAVSHWLNERVHPEDRARVAEVIHKALASRSAFDMEYRLRHADGAFGWMLLRVVPLLGTNGEIVEWFGAASDIAMRKRAEEALRENEGRLRFLDALGKDTAKSMDADAILLTTTRMLGQHLGVAVCAYADMDPDQDGFTIRGDWAAPGSSSIVGHYSLAAFGKLAVKNLQAGLPLVLDDNRTQLPPEEAATFLGIGLAATICLPLVKEGRLTALMAIHDKVPRVWKPQELALLTEVTERSWAHIERVRSEAEARLAEQRFRQDLEAKVAERTAALEQSEASIRTIFETSHLYQGLLTTDGRILYANATSLKDIGAKLEDVAGLPLWEAPWYGATPGVPEAIKQAIERVAAGAIENISLNLDLPSGVRSFDFSLRPVLNESGAVVAIVPEAVEKTARVKAEQALQQVQKMEALGNLTGGIAHDFNNLLMAVLGSLELLRKRMPAEPALLRLLDNAKAGAERGASLTARLLAFARKQELRFQRINLQQLVIGMTELLESSLGPTIRIYTYFSAQLSAVETDPNQLESALLNLAVNARDAMHGEGTITITAREEKLAAGEHGLPAGRYICLSVSDTGEGMDEATLKRASEPFFTTKGIGKGTGLGLSMVHGLAEQSGGALVLRSALGIGTNATIWLPAAQAAETVPVLDAAPHLLSSTGPTLTILAVDDDDLVLLNTADMLREHGHQVLTARSGKEALELIGANRLDLLITDHAMPQMTGTQLATQVRLQQPDLPILLVSGYADLPPNQVELPRLAKPFSQAGLMAAVIKVTAARA
ncbi:PAS domain-containing protein [Pseudomonas borbori]